MGGDILPNLSNSQETEPQVSGPLEPKPLGTKSVAGATWKKKQDGAGAAKTLSGALM